MLAQVDRRDVHALALLVLLVVLHGLVVDVGVEVAVLDGTEQAVARLEQRLQVGLVGLVDVLRLLHARPRAELLGVQPAEVELCGERPHQVGVRLTHLRREPLVVEVEGVHAGVREAVLAARRDRPGLQADGVEAVHDLALGVEHGDVAVPEQFRDDRRVGVLAPELELQDAVEAVLAYLVEVRAGEPIAQHLREVRRSARRVRHVFRVGDVRAFRLSHLDEELHPSLVEIPHLQAEEVVAVEVGLVDFRPRVLVEFRREGDEVDARHLPLLVHANSVVGPYPSALRSALPTAGRQRIASGDHWKPRAEWPSEARPLAGRAGSACPTGGRARERER